MIYVVQSVTKINFYYSWIEYGVFSGYLDGRARGGGGYNWKYNVPLGYWERYPLDLGADKLELCGSLLKIKYK